VADASERQRGLTLVTELRRSGFSAELDLAGRSMKGQLKQADRIGARHTVILEADGSAQLRDMQSGEQRPADLAKLAEELR
jgi:histidyl-tRNA synthetase